MSEPTKLDRWDHWCAGRGCAYPNCVNNPDSSPVPPAMSLADQQVAYEAENPQLRVPDGPIASGEGIGTQGEPERCETCGGMKDDPWLYGLPVNGESTPHYHVRDVACASEPFCLLCVASFHAAQPSPVVQTPESEVTKAERILWEIAKKINSLEGLPVDFGLTRRLSELLRGITESVNQPAPVVPVGETKLLAALREKKMADMWRNVAEDAANVKAVPTIIVPASPTPVVSGQAETFWNILTRLRQLGMFDAIPDKDRFYAAWESAKTITAPPSLPKAGETALTYDKEEWRDFATEIKPELTDGEFDDMWERFMELKKKKELQ